MDIKSHFRQLQQENTSFYFMHCGAYVWAGELIDYKDEDEPGFIVQDGGFKVGDLISVGYALSAYLYTFETRITKVELFMGAVLLSLQQPAKIARLEQGKAQRAKARDNCPAIEFRHTRESHSHTGLHFFEGQRAGWMEGAKTGNKTVLVAIRDLSQGRYAFMCSGSPVCKTDDAGAPIQMISADIIDFREDDS